MKKIVLFITLLFLPILVNASSGKITISSTNTVVVGNKVTVTVTLSGSDIGSWELNLNYDKNYLKLTSSSAEAGGTVMAASVPSPITSKKYTFKFQTLKKGTTTISMKGYEAYAYSNLEEIKLTTNEKKIQIITQEELEASYSKDNYLKKLSIEGYELDKEFQKDVLEYNINVKEGTNTIKINATPNDSKASISGDGEVKVTAGTNIIKVIVRAENGSERTYTLSVNVIDQNPINVNIGDKEYTVVKLRENYECPESFTEKDISINDISIPACYNEALNYDLVGLKLSDGTIENYIYKNNNYVKYNEVIGTSLKIVILDYDNNLNGLEKYTTNIDGVNYNVFKVNDNSKNYIVYGINVLTGEKNFYNYDSINKTFSLYDESLLNEANKLNNLYLYIIIAFAACLFLAIICVITLLCKLSKLKKIKKEQDIKEEKAQEVKSNKKKKEESKKETAKKQSKEKIEE